MAEYESTLATVSSEDFGLQNDLEKIFAPLLRDGLIFQRKGDDTLRWEVLALHPQIVPGGTLRLADAISVLSLRGYHLSRQLDELSGQEILVKENPSSRAKTISARQRATTDACPSVRVVDFVREFFPEGIADDEWQLIVKRLQPRLEIEAALMDYTAKFRAREQAEAEVQAACAKNPTASLAEAISKGIAAILKQQQKGGVA